MDKAGKTRLRVRIFIWMSVLISAGLVFCHALAWDGSSTYSYNPSNPRSAISRLTPIDRVVYDGDRTLVQGEPAYFSWLTARTYERAELKMKYRRPRIGVPIIQVGPLSDPLLKQYEYSTIDHALIDGLSDDWKVVSEDGLYLYQRGRHYESITDFMTDPPALSKLAVFASDWRPDYQPASSAVLQGEYTFPYALRGAWRAYVYVGEGQDLLVELAFSDLNRNLQEDPLEVVLRLDGQVIASKKMPDDGILGDGGKISSGRSLSWREPGLPAGVYSLELRSNDDIVTDRFRVSQSLYVFRGALRLHRRGSFSKPLMADAQRLFLRTDDPSALGNFSCGQSSSALSETYRQFAIDCPGIGVKQLVLPADGIEIGGRGVVAATKENYFNPDPLVLDNDQVLDDKQIEYILSSYAAHTVTADVVERNMMFDLNNAYREKGQYGFSLSVPGISSTSALEIISLELSGYGPNMIELLSNKIRNVYERIQ